MSDLEALADAINRQTELLAGVLKEKTGGTEEKAAGAVNTSTLLFGTGGIFAVPGVDPNIVTAHVRPHGIANDLPAFASVTENPRFGVLTGYTATTGSEAVNPCDDNPAGFVKACTLTSQFGRVARDTQTIEWDKVMLKMNNGVNTDLQLRGRVLGLTDLEPSSLSQDQIMSIVTMSEMVTVGVNLERTLSRHIWQGNVANNTAGGGYKEFPGLDQQIATGHVDSETNTACPAVDSDVKNFAYDNVDGNDGRTIVEYLSALEFYLRYNAEKMGLDPVEWVIAMRPELWYVLSDVWPAQYNTNPLNVVIGNSSRVFVDGRENVNERDLMRTQGFIVVNGNRYRVVTDTGINELNNVNDANLAAGEYASSIYMVPLTILGNFPVTYFEHVDYRRGAADIALLGRAPDFWTDGGMYSWAIEAQKWCYKLSAKTERRIVLRTPHLAGRIDAVKYDPLQHLREGYPDSAYFADGGVSLRSSESLNAVWQS